MREILFRGRTKDGKWHNGWYVKATKSMKTGFKQHEDWIVSGFSANGGWIVPLSRYAVDADTVGQYTGLKDKNGVKIFEGDIVIDITERYISKEKKSFGIAVVKFGKHEVQSDDPFCYGDAYGWYFDGNTVRETPIQYYGYNEYVRDERLQFEVIGNIYDNQELLEDEQNDRRTESQMSQNR